MQGMDLQGMDRTPSPEPGEINGEINDPYVRLEQAKATYAAAWPNFQVRRQAWSNAVEQLSDKLSCYEKLPLKKLITLKDEAAHDLAVLHQQGVELTFSLGNLIDLANAAHKMRDVLLLRDRESLFASNIELFEKKLQDVDKTITFLALSAQVPTLRYREFVDVSKTLQILNVNNQKSTLQSTLQSPVKVVLTADFLKGDPESPMTKFLVGQVQKYKNACIKNHSHGKQLRDALWVAQMLELDPRTIYESNSIEGSIDPELLRRVAAYDVAIDLLTKKPEPIVAPTDESEATSSNIQSVRAKRPRNP